jgi:disulfide bond formation protein DsbB
MCESDDRLGNALTAGDFNADGYDDLAVGVYSEDVGSADDAGAVNVIYGSASGLFAEGNQMWNQNSPRVLGICESYDRYGWALMSGDFNDDGYSDLAIGTQNESLGTNNDAGVVNVLYGSTNGLSAAGNQMWHQNSPGILGICEKGDQFGSTLAAGDFNGDGYADLAIGVPYEDIGTVKDAGAVNVLYGSKIGLSATNNQLIHQNLLKVLGVCNTDDRFGSAVTAGDFDHDGYDDLAIGVPHEKIGNQMKAGALNVMYGSSRGLSAAGNQMWHQNTPGILGICEDNDIFGNTLITIDFGIGYDNLAVGCPGESIAGVNSAGAVNVLHGSSSGISAIGDQLWHQNSPGILGFCEEDDNFGDALAS